MKCAIMQPTFLPWVGYFNLMSKVDIFVFFDDVQLQRRSWQMRNRILANGSEVLITVPLQKAPRETFICNSKPSIDSKWIITTLRQIEHAYAKAPYKNVILEFLDKEFAEINPDLASFNIKIILHLADLINLKVKTKRSKDLKSEGHRSDKLYSLCKTLDCDTYISPMGSKDYLEEDGVFEKGDIQLICESHTPIEYKQIGVKEFVPYMSIIDLIANVGPENALEYILDKDECRR